MTELEEKVRRRLAKQKEQLRSMMAERGEGSTAGSAAAE